MQLIGQPEKPGKKREIRRYISKYMGHKISWIPANRFMQTDGSRINIPGKFFQFEHGKFSTDDAKAQDWLENVDGNGYAGFGEFVFREGATAKNLTPASGVQISTGMQSTGDIQAKSPEKTPELGLKCAKCGKLYKKNSQKALENHEAKCGKK